LNPSPAGAAAIPPITDTKADVQRDLDGTREPQRLTIGAAKRGQSRHFALRKNSEPFGRATTVKYVMLYALRRTGYVAAALGETVRAIMFHRSIAGAAMLTLYSYPKLFGVADSNAYGLKVFAFMRLTGVPFKQEHVFDVSAWTVGRLPHITDDAETISDSDSIIHHLIHKHHLSIDEGLTARQRDANHLIKRMLDDLYWVMSYSRWKDQRYWPAFRDAVRTEHPGITEEDLCKAQEHNLQRYHYHGIGRYEADAALARGLADLEVLANFMPANHYVHGPKPTGIDAAIYGFIANICFWDIGTPLKQFVVARENIVRHCEAIHAAVIGSPRKVDGLRSADRLSRDTFTMSALPLRATKPLRRTK
jgi:glutathione S-transferase